MGRSNPPDPGLLEYCRTDHQRACLQAWIDTGSSYKAAKKMGTTQPFIVKMRGRIAQRAANKGYISPGMDLSDKVGAGFGLNNGYSLLTKTPDGEPIWLKASKDRLLVTQAIEQYAESLATDIGTVGPCRKPPKTMKHDPDLMASIWIGDSHYGMYAHAPETKHSDYDSQKAYDLMCAAIDDLVERAPAAETGLLVDVGDYTHSNSSLNQTFKGTAVDVDTRLGRVMDLAGMGMQYAIRKMLTKFKKVVVVVARGNHNPDVALAIQRITSAFFSTEPRVQVLDTIGYFHYIEWGKWLIGVNHGDKVKPEKLVQMMARDMPAAWGRTTCRMWGLGHVHHQDVREIDGVLVQKFAALPPPDGWHASMGYSSGQAMQMIVHRKQGGRHSTLIHELPRPDHDPDITI